ncbi:alpha/beta fold hydrolase [Acidovorax sp.]|uniref:alpha/beta fold hydrolase n=1 Tax=Acidovorax sp. TaxID=1872122 RepID=UPI003CFF87F3
MPKLRDVCSHIRSKNAGPFWITIDLTFPDRGTFDLHSTSPAIGPGAIAAMFDVEPGLVKHFLVPELAVVKISYPRKRPQGGALERDMHGGQQYNRLLEIDMGAPKPVPAIPVPVVDQHTLGGRGHFFVGGSYAGPPEGQTMAGQMFVEVLVPKEVRKPYPLVLLHGAGQTATCWMQTPDGRKGWADYFVEQGYIVYLVDQPMRGRSAWHPADGPTRNYTAQAVEAQFTACAQTTAWSEGKLHTQWPGSGPGRGRRGDPVFDAFYASMVETLVSNEDTAIRTQAAFAALLDKMGPAVLLTHSQGGSFGWAIADARPGLVKAIVAIEPSGPPFNALEGRPRSGLKWGVSDIALTYDPPVDDPAQLAVVAHRSEPHRVACERQQEPARQLVNLQNVPVLVVTGEASYHAAYDHGTVDFLRQAGVQVDFIRLEERGIHGNGHMMMLEANNLEIAACLDDWIAKSTRGD